MITQRDKLAIDCAQKALRGDPLGRFDLATQVYERAFQDGLRMASECVRAIAPGNKRYQDMEFHAALNLLADDILELGK